LSRVSHIVAAANGAVSSQACAKFQEWERWEPSARDFVLFEPLPRV